MKHILPFLLAGAWLSSCDLLEPADVQNPNVVADDFIASPDAMKAWVNGSNAAVAEAVGTFVENLELLSDNYYNNYTRSSKTFDKPEISYRAVEVSRLSTHIGKLVQMATFGLDKVAPADAETTDAQRFNLQWIRAYAHLLAGENFVALPFEAKGEVVEWPELLRAAIRELDAAEALAADGADRAFLALLRARAYQQLGDRAQASQWAQKALQADASLLRSVSYDGINGVVNAAHEYIGSYMFQPLPRLDFLDPKYPYASYWDAPVAIAKAEEAYLILAENALAEGQTSACAAQLQQLLQLIAQRPVSVVIDSHDKRDNGGTVVYPNGCDYLVAASPADSLRHGLMRQHGVEDASAAYAVATVSGTSVTSAMIAQAAASSSVDLLELVYLMRQEVFFAEGRRASDLGFRLPVSEVEAALHPALPEAYTRPVIPEYIPLGGEMDAFTIDAASHTVTIRHNMNRRLAEVLIRQMAGGK